MNKDEYEKIKNEVDATLAEIIEEFSAVTELLKKDTTLVRTRLLIAFSFLEVISGIFDKYYGLNLTNALLLKKWMKEYCLVQKNEIYKNHPYLHKIDEEYLYILRNGIIHAFALPEPPDPKFAIVFPNGIETADNMRELENVLIKDGKIPVFISPDSLTNLFIQGSKILMEEMFVPFENTTPEKIEGLKRVQMEFHRRSAKGFSV